MTIPAAKLVLLPINWDNLTLVQHAVLAGRTDDIMDIRDFLLTTSRWRRQDINRITYLDIPEIVGMVQEEIERQVSPNENLPSLKAGQEEQAT